MPKKIFYLFSFLPILDLITALLTRNNISITPGLISKGLFLIIGSIYMLITKSKYRKLNYISLLSMFLYSICYFIFKPELLISSNIFREISYLSKLLFFPISFLTLISYIDEYKISKHDIIKVIIINAILYLLLLFIPLLLGNAYTTYPRNLKGTIGWFYSGNEVSVIVNLLFPVILLINSKEKIFTIITIAFMFISIYIGTKVATLGITILTFIYFILSLFKKENRILSLILTIICAIFVLNSNALYNNRYRVENELNQTEKETIKESLDEETIAKVDNIELKLEELSKENSLYQILNFLLNGRTYNFANTLSIYNDNYSVNNIIFGIGFTNTKNINNQSIQRLIEIDFLDIFFHFGIIGLLIMFMPYFILLYLLLKNKINFNINFIYITLLMLLIFAIANLGGHVFFYPAVSIYISLYLILILYNQNIIKEKELKEKVSILALHLNIGGIEKAITDEANMLSEVIDVEIASLYKFSDMIPYKLNDKVKVKYLSNLKPNKKEFKKAVNNKNILLILKEGFKAVYILMKKPILLIKYICACDSKIIISTRVEFTKLLNIYHNEKAITISEEHSYHHNDKKYIRKVVSSCTNIDYLIPSSKYLTKDYQKYLPNKVKYLPLVINYFPKNENKLNNNNIISVGRLEKEKGYLDLIDIMKLVKDKNPKIKLTLVGDGSLKNEIISKIKSYHLEKNITLKGFLTPEDLKGEYQKASLYVMTSFEESFGLVLIEAMSYGIPCFAFDSALGAKEIINKKSGLLIPNRDKERMAKEILKYFSQKKKYNSRETANNYYIDKVKIKWQTFIMDLLKEPK